MWKPSDSSVTFISARDSSMPASRRTSVQGEIDDAVEIRDLAGDARLARAAAAQVDHEAGGEVEPAG